MFKTQIGLISTIDRLRLPAKQLSQVLTIIEREFDSAVITVTNTTNPSVLTLIQETTVNSFSVPRNGAANGRRLVVSKFLEVSRLSDKSLILHIDFDKLATMIIRKPDAFHHLITKMRLGISFDYACVNRSSENMQTYPKAWTDTETCTNKCAQAFFELSDFTDFTSGAAIIRQKFLSFISEASNAKMIDAEWPLIVKQHNGQIGSVETAGLPFTQLNREVTQKPLWQRYADRIRLVQQIIEPLTQE